MKCFYHCDADGIMSAYCVRKFTKDEDENNYKQINYGWKFPFEIISPNEEVYIVDFSLEIEDMRKLLEITKNVLWIDHHKTSIEKYNNFEEQISGIRVSGYAGCVLAYWYLRDKTETSLISKAMLREIKNSSDEPTYSYVMGKTPMHIAFVGDRDVWTYIYGEDTSIFHEFFMGMNLNPFSKELDNMTNNQRFIDRYMEQGRIMMVYKKSLSAKYCKSIAFETEFEGYSVCAMNAQAGIADSTWFDSIDTSKYDILMLFSYNGKMYSYSLYSKTVDVSEIALKYGGGGHKGAAGFRSEEMILKKKE